MIIETNVNGIRAFRVVDDDERAPKRRSLKERERIFENFGRRPDDDLVMDMPRPATGF